MLRKRLQPRSESRVVQRELSPQIKFPYRWLIAVILLIIVIGVSLRWVNLAQKIYWHDEVYTSLRITGHTGHEIRQQLAGRIIDAKALLQYQQLDPNRGLDQALHSMATEDAQHPPLYFVLLRCWVQLFGNSVTTIRSLSVLISLLLFPAMYWLCWELFGSSVIGWIAIALVASSPVNLWLAQDAREYGLWMVMVVVSSAALLRALRLNTPYTWLLYAMATATGLYTYLLQGLVMLSHGIYVLTQQSGRFSQVTRAYLIASVLGLTAIIPWGIVVIQNFETVQHATNWLKMTLPFSVVYQSWILNASRLLLDFDLKLESGWAYALTLAIVALEVYALYWLCHYTPARVYGFVLSLIGVMALYLLLPDLILGGIRSIVTRYLIPCYVGLQLAVAYLLATKMSGLQAIQRQAWQWVTLGLVTIGLVSCSANAWASTWWNREVSYGHAQMTQAINQTTCPLVIGDMFGMNVGNLISLSYTVHPNVQYFLLPEVSKQPEPPKIPTGYSEVFFLNLPKEFLQKIEQVNQVNIVPVVPSGISSLWRVQSQPPAGACTQRSQSPTVL